ncbi:acyl-CoA dehydrogenase [Mycolicibacterium doricum]|uniref:Acyl-CoA dehydrogenase n=1 Tax=Mycolicibacterium doricum TaxID=126673 RepID=A0A1X1SXQ3_9MYCO|nr:acyl-CoA dehydrogenase [Mycolicibacterium doricum]MCV7267648.1 acyl-CoA dehydrogenase [Mycolicibacterium doricum]ORV35873.1 acyl-CoA dehydrogenase [Mycolicibacterium doricum]BBZ05903.1 acyl-CoA dehydrogenase [Mycolicibacterium doricum]
MSAELRVLVDNLARRSYDARMGQRTRPETFDAALWRHLEETGLSRLTTGEGAGPAESAVVLAGLARRSAAVPAAETDLLAAWLARQAGVDVPASGPLTVAVCAGTVSDGRVVGAAHRVPWPRDATVVAAVRSAEALYVSALDDPVIVDGMDLAGEPRGEVTVDVAENACVRLDPAFTDELMRRGAWARCVQTVGAFDAAADLTATHTRDRVQFGRSLSKFQAVQHALAAMAGEVERARATTELAVAAAAQYGFGAPATHYAVTVAKVTVGRAVEPVTTIAHQLHGAIGVTVEHPLWLSTMRARGWVDDFGPTARHARELGRLALSAGDPWDVLVGP